ncbi:hypothetical protein CEXT_509341, partial [Caerostris extrusa]
PPQSFEPNVVAAVPECHVHMHKRRQRDYIPCVIEEKTTH